MLVESEYNNGEGMDEATKVQHFKTGIKPKANLEIALTTMRAGTVNLNDFSAVKSFLAGEIKAHQARSDEIDYSRGHKYDLSQIKSHNDKGRGNSKLKVLSHLQLSMGNEWKEDLIHITNGPN